MLKTLIASFVFTVAVFVGVDFIGDALVPQNVSFQQGVHEKQTMGPMTASTMATSTMATSTMATSTMAAKPERSQPLRAPASISGDAVLGQKLFQRKCAGCHTAQKGAANRTGPNLWGIVGRMRASATGFRYSPALKALGGVWSAADINRFIAKPRAFVPGTKMGFSGLKKDQDRANVVAYLGTLKD